MTISMSMTTLAAAAVTGAVAGGIAAAGFVNLQDSSPGATQAGHTNITGNAIAGRVGAGTNPTLARVQALETGGLQGVRAETNTGVAVFGKSTAATGLGAGGYFTTSSVGGRGIVGDALSGTGNTVGGLFYNRSTGGGVGVWGRAIGNGTATGVFGESVASTGRGGAFSNTGSGKSVSMATASAAIEATGDIRMDIAGTMESMVPLGYGWIDSAGNKVGGTGGWTSTWNAGNNWYEITFTGKNFSIANGIIIANPAGSTNRKCGGDSVSSKALVRITDQAGTAVQQQFLFIAYSRTNGAAPPFASPVPKGMTDSEWVEKYPREAKAYFAKLDAWRAQQNQASYGMPDEAEIRP